MTIITKGQSADFFVSAPQFLNCSEQNLRLYRETRIMLSKWCSNPCKTNV